MGTWGIRMKISFARRGVLPMLSLAVLLAAVPAMPAKADDKADVDAATARWIDAFNRKNMQDIVALYAPDAVFFGTVSPVLRDTPALVREYFTAQPVRPDVSISLEEHRVQVFGNVAISTGFYTRSGMEEGKMVRSPARFTFVYEKRGGQWVIVTHHSSALPTP